MTTCILSDEYETEFGNMVHKIFDYDKCHENELGLFWPVTSKEFVPKSGCMVIGQAAGESDIRIQKKPRELPFKIAKARVHSETFWPEILIHEWKESGKYKYKPSGRFTYLLKKSAQEENMSICWTQLYKVTLGNGNPPDWLREAQKDLCIKLLKLELKELCPQKVLVLAGKNWYGGFLKELEFQEIHPKPEGSFIEAIAMRDGVKWVLAKHPQDRRLKKSEQELWDEIDKAFKGDP